MKKLAFFTFLLTFQFATSAQYEMQADESVALVRDFTVEPNFVQNKSRYDRVLRTLKNDFLYLLSENRIRVLPDADKLYEDTGELELRTITDYIVWGNLVLPDPLIEEKDFKLTLEINQYTKDSEANKKTIVVNLGSAPKNFKNKLFDNQFSILNAFSIKKKFNTSLNKIFELKTYERDGFQLEHNADSFFVSFPVDSNYFFTNYDSLKRIFLTDNKFTRTEKCYRWNIHDDKMILDCFKDKIPIVNGKKIDLNSIFWKTKFKEQPQTFGFYSEKQIFNILIYPFDHYDNCNNDLSKYCTKAVRESIVNMSIQEHINVDVRVSKQFNTPQNSLDYQTAQKIGEVSKADLIIWGDYEKQCEWDSTLINIKFLPMDVKSKVHNVIGNRLETGFQDVNAISSIINDNRLVGDIKDIVYYSLGSASSNCDVKDRLYSNLSIPKDKAEYIPQLAEVALCLIRIDDFTKAKIFLDRAIEIDSLDINTLNTAISFYRKQNQYKKVIPYCEKLGELYPASALPTIALADYYTRIRNYTKALDLIETSYEDKEDWSFFYYKGELNKYLKKDSIAIINYQKSISLIEDLTRNDYAYRMPLRISNIYRGKGDMENAEKYINIAYETESKSEDCPNESLFARINFNISQNKDTAQILSDYDAIISSGFGKVKESALRGKIYYLRKIGRIKDAIIANDALIKYDPENEHALKMKFEMYAIDSDTSMAIMSINNLIDKSRSTRNLMDRAKYLTYIDNHDEAKRDLYEIIKIDETNQFAYNGLAFIYIQTNSYNKDSAYFLIRELANIYYNNASKSRNWDKKPEHTKNRTFYISNMVNTISPHYIQNDSIIQTRNLQFFEFLENNLEHFFPEENEYIELVKFNLSKSSFWILEKLGKSEELIKIVESHLYNENNTFINEGERSRLYHTVAKQYMKLGNSKKVLSALDSYLYHYFNSVIHEKSRRNVLNRLEKDNHFKDIQEDEKFIKLIEKYNWLIDNS